MKRFLMILSVIAALLLLCITPVAAADGDEVALASPVIYGDFNNYAIEGTDAKPLTETASGSGIFKASYNFDTYTGTGGGYSVFVCVTKKDYGQYGWGAGEQYTLTGEAAAMGSVSVFKPAVSGLYEFTYDSHTHLTTVLPPEVTFELPVVYGDFNNWAIEGENAKALTETAAGSGIYKASYNLDAYTGTGGGYSIYVCLSKKNYGQYGWGAGTQYTLSGEAAGMGSVSVYKPTVAGLYEFTYDSNTHITTILPPEIAFELPVLYGDFNNWAIEGENSEPLTETGAGTGIFQGTYAFDAYTGTGEGYTAIVCVSKKNYGQYGWGAGTQYVMDGTAAGFGSKSYFKPNVSGNYLVSYNSSTHVTTITLVQAETPTTTNAESPATADTGITIYIISGVLSAAAVTLNARKIRK